MRRACEPISWRRFALFMFGARVVGSSSSDGLSRLLLFERHRYGRVCRETNPLFPHVGDQPEVDEMCVVLVVALAAVALGEPDASVGDTVDGTDVNAVRADHFHVLDDLVRGHLCLSLWFRRLWRTRLAPPAGLPG